MDKHYNVSSQNVSEKSDIQVFWESIKNLYSTVKKQFRTYVIPNAIKILYKLSILKDIDQDLTPEEDIDHEYTLKIVNSCNHSKQISLLDMAVFTSPELQDCIINQKTLKETVIDFQVVKSKLFIENRSSKGNFLYEGALLEQISENLSSMTSALKKVYLDFFCEEVYKYHCNSFLDISFLDIYDEKWLNRVVEKLSENNNTDILTADYPKEVLNKFRFIYMLIKVQEIKYESIKKRQD